MKKSVSLIMALVLMVSMLAGCSSNTEQPEQTQKDSEQQSTPVEPAADGENSETPSEPQEQEADGPAMNTYPLSDGSFTVSVWQGFNPQTTDYISDLNENSVYIKLEEITGVHVDFTLVHPASQSERFNIMAASGEYTDILNDAGRSYSGGYAKALADEVVINFADLIRKEAPNYYNLLNSDEALMRDVTMDGGEIVSFANVFTQAVPAWAGQMIRQDWLDELGLDTPETYDELHDVLTAFKDQLGADSALFIPSTGLPGNDYLLSGYGISSEFYQEDGVVKYGLIQDGFRDYLEMMQTWYREGLIWNDFISGDTRDMNLRGDTAAQLLYSGRTGVWYAETADMSTYAESSGDSSFDAVALAATVRETGETVHFGYLPSRLNSMTWSISTDCEDPDTVVKWIDYWYSDEGSKLCTWGVEGEAMELDDSGNPTFTELITNNPDGMTTNIAIYVYAMDVGPFVLDRSRSEASYTDRQKESALIWDSNSDYVNVLPNNMSFTDVESEEYASLYTDIQTYAQENIANFITGVKPISEFDDFVATFKSMKIDRCVEIVQAEYNRYLTR